MTNLDSILKSRNTTWPTKVHPVKVMVFPGVMYGCESWTIKKAELWRIDVFELWCWRRLLRVPWTARRSNQSFLKEIHPKYSLEGLMRSSNTLATWCEELIHQKRPWYWERLKAGEGEDRGRDSWMASPTLRIWVSVNSGSWWQEAWRAAVHGAAKSQTRLSNWTELIVDLHCCVGFWCMAKWSKYLLYHLLFHYGLSQDTEYSSLCYTG